MLAATFIGRGVEALRSPKPAADAARPTLDGLSKLPDPVGPHVPTNAETVARVNGAVQIGAGLLLATGKLPRFASAALALSVVPGSLGGHAFWAEVDPALKAEQRRAFMTDISLIGGLIIASVDTEGKPSLGWRGRRAARKFSDAVVTALPVGAASSGALTDSALAEKLGHGLHAGAERGREIAHLALERGASWPTSPASVHPSWPSWPATAAPNLLTWHVNAGPRLRSWRAPAGLSSRRWLADAAPNSPTSPATAVRTRRRRPRPWRRTRRSRPRSCTRVGRARP